MDVINFFTMSLKLNANYIDEWCRSYVFKINQQATFRTPHFYRLQTSVSALTFLSALTLHEKTKGKISDSETESYSEQKNSTERVENSEV